jgi:single-stranded DNA-binding protein
MARENSVRLYGQILDVPAIYFNKDSEPTRGHFILKVLRRPTANDRYYSNIYYDCPVILTRNENMLKEHYTQLQKGDMVIVEGVICSREVSKTAICPNCNASYAREGLITFIHPLLIMKTEEKASDEIGIERLHENIEISNKNNVIGRLCKNPEIYETDTARITQYLIAVSRKYRIVDDAERDTDFIWIKTYGKQAEQDFACLSKNSIVYISGAIQTREIKKKAYCDECDCDFEIEDSVTEIVPYSVEYLENYDAETLREFGKPKDTEDSENDNSSKKDFEMKIPEYNDDYNYEADDESSDNTESSNDDYKVANISDNNIQDDEPSFSQFFS